MLRQVVSDIRRMKTVSELLDYIPHKALEKASYALLCVLCALPLFSILNCAIFGERTNDSDLVFATMTYQYDWACLVEIIGLLGIIAGIVALSKSVLENSRSGNNVQDFLRAHSVQLLLAALLLWSTISCALSDNMEKSILGDGYRQEGLMMYFS